MAWLAGRRLPLWTHLVIACVAAMAPLAALALVPGADDAALRRALVGLAIGAAIALAAMVARMVGRSIARITRVVDAVGRGASVGRVEAPVLELYELSRAVDEAGRARVEAEGRLADRARRFKTLLEQVPVALVGVDRTRRVVVYNHAAAALLGCPSHDAVAGTIDRFVSQDFRRLLDARFTQPLARRLPTAETLPLVAFRQDGSEFSAEATLARVSLGDEVVLVLLLRDVSESRRRETEQVQRLAHEAAARADAEATAQRAVLLANLGSVLAAGGDTTALLTAAADRVTASYADCCVLDWLDGATTVRRVVAGAAHVTDEVARLAGARPPGSPAAELIAKVAASGQPELLSEMTHANLTRLATSHEELGLLSGLGFRSAVVVPLAGARAVHGVMTLARVADPPFTSAELGFTLELAQAIGAAMERAAEHRAAREAQGRVAELVEHVDAIVWQAEPDSLELRFVSEQAERLLGYPRGQWADDPRFWWTVIHPEDREAVRARIEDAVRSGRNCRLEHRVIAADGRVRWVTNLVYIRRAADGAAASLHGLVLDMTDQKSAEEERDRQLATEQAARADAETAARRAKLLARASDLLSSSLDYDATLESLTRLAVPMFADWCLVHLTEPATGRRVYTACADSAHAPLAAALERLAPSLAAPSLLPVIDFLSQGEVLLLPQVGGEWLEMLRLLQQVAPTSIMAVPLAARGRSLGTLTFISTRADHRYGDADLALARDLAQRAAIAVDNARLYAEAAQANQAKDEFLATLSHELRTPLTAIMGWILMLKRGALSAERAAQALASIERNTRLQTRLIDDLLDISRIVAGKLKLERRPVDLRAVIDHALESIRRDVEGKALLLDHQTTPFAVWVNGDPVRLEQVVLNLLGNAVKFTPEGGRIEIRLERHEDTAVLSVQDNGAGIEPELLPHVFDSFRQADATSTRRHGGLGLGLAIVRRLVELHHGSVEASSAGKGAGATFTVRLPVTAASGTAGTESAREQRRARGPLPTTRLDGVHVLVVEDHEDSRDFVRAVLADSGAEVSVAGGVEEAVDILRHTYIDVVLTDIQMPGSNGYELVTRLRETEREHGGHIPAIALTAYAGPDDRARALAAGFQSYLAKPVGPDELTQAVALAVGRATIS